jgi:hypothetical protein
LAEAGVEVSALSQSAAAHSGCFDPEPRPSL